MARGSTLVLSASAVGGIYGPSLRWSADGGVSRVRSAQSRRPGLLFAPGAGLVGWRRVGTVTLSCTAHGTATLTAGLVAGVSHVTRVNVDCRDRVRVEGLSDTAAFGAGTVTVSDEFSVTPAAAVCTATAAAGVPVVAVGAGGARSVSVGVAAGSSVGVTVTCSHAGYADGVGAAAFAARAADPCGTHLGTLAGGTVSRSGSIAAVSGCVSPQRVRDGGSSKRYWARRHTFTLAAPATVRVDVASPTRRGLDAYVLLLEGHSADGTGAVVGRDNNSGPRNGARLSDLKLAPGDYTIEVTTANKRRTGAYRLAVAVTPAPAACSSDLGTLAAGRYPASGTVADDDGCVSAHAGTAASRPHARRHTFTLTAPAWVDIDLAPATASSLDPYLVLADADGTALAHDNDSGTGTAAQIRGKHLQAGAYTIEATANTSSGDTAVGAYDLTVTVPIHGLPNQIDAVVDQQTTINFNYWPTTAHSATAVSSTLTALDTAASASNGTGSVTVVPHLVREHQVTLSLKIPASGGTRGTRSTRSVPAERPEPVEYEFGVVSVCPEGETAGSAGGALCGIAAGTDAGPMYQVTPGTLIGTRKAVRDSLAELSRPCYLSENQLTALMLVIGFRELPGAGDYAARSAMALGRIDIKDWVHHPADAEGERMWPLGEFGSLDEEESEPLDLEIDPRTWPAPAFFSPGVGMWQLDDANPTFRLLNHGERASTVIGGRAVADYFRNAVCDEPDAAQRLVKIKRALNPWHACTKGDYDSSEKLYEKYLCLEPDGEDDLAASYSRLYIEEDDDGIDGLHVTTEGLDEDDENPRRYGIAGGVHAWECRWGSSGEAFDCWFYDTTSPEGWLDAYDPQANDSDSWRYDTFDWRADPDKKDDQIRAARTRCPDDVVASAIENEVQFITAWCRVRNPLPVPFFSFTRDKFRYAVFPKSVLATLNVGTGTTAHTLIKRVKIDRNVRSRVLSSEGPSWERNTRRTTDLQVQICDGTVPELGRLPSQCPWVSVNDASLARRLGVTSGPSYR